MATAPLNVTFHIKVKGLYADVRFVDKQPSIAFSNGDWSESYITVQGGLLRAGSSIRMEIFGKLTLGVCLLHLCFDMSVDANMDVGTGFDLLRCACVCVCVRAGGYACLQKLNNMRTGAAVHVKHLPSPWLVRKVGGLEACDSRLGRNLPRPSSSLAHYRKAPSHMTFFKMLA